MNLGPRGVTTTLGIPGTGLSYTSRLPAAEPRPPRAAPSPRQPQLLPRAEPTSVPGPAGHRPDQPNVWFPQPGMRAISSASVESLTSEPLRDLRDIIVAARRQRTEVDGDLTEARQLLGRSRTLSADAPASSDGSTANVSPASRQTCR